MCQIYPSVPNIQAGVSTWWEFCKYCGQNKFLPIEFSVCLDVMCTDFQRVPEEVLCAVLGDGEAVSDCLTLSGRANSLSI